MKTIIIVIFVFGFFGCSSSQPATTDFSDFYNEHEDDAGIVSFSIPVGIAKAFVEEDDLEAKKALGKIKKIRFFICDKDNGFYGKQLQNYLPDVYHDLMIIKEGKETVTFKMKEPEKGKVSEILLIVSEPNSFVAISFTGKFSTDDAEKFAGSIKSDKVAGLR